MCWVILLESSFEAVDDTMAKVQDKLELRCGLRDSRFLFNLSFVCRELLNNAVEHGNQMNIDYTVTLHIHCNKHGLVIEVGDHGGGVCQQLQKYSSNTFTDISRHRKRGLATVEKLGWFTNCYLNSVRAVWQGPIRREGLRCKKNTSKEI